MSSKTLGMISGKVRVADVNNLDPNRFEFLDLANAEPNPGVPPESNGILASNTDGSRKWLVPNQGISVSSDNKLFVDINNIIIDSENLSFSDSNTLVDLFSDLDNTLQGIISNVETDETISGDGTEEDPLSVDYGVVNIVTRNEITLVANLTNFLSICFRTDSAFRNDGAKAFTRSEEQILLI